MKTANKILLITGGLSLAALLLLRSCTVIPKKARAVTNLEKEKYLGTWYEIARLDFKYEKNLNNTTARYSVNDDGSIRVENSGYDYIQNKQKKAIGKAKFRKSEQEGMLKVSFFGPFYSGYNILSIDDDYRYALVAGKNLKYLWFLSRETTMPDNIKNKYLSMANAIGYDTSDLIWVEHNR